jgi:hypothetical protein
MASKCPNCKRTYSCGCQARKATDGTQTCASCVKQYNAKLKQQNLNKFIK